MQRLFNVANIGVFLDSYSPGTEKRREDDVKVLHLNLRVQPFDAKHAIAIDDGLANGTNIRRALFNLSTDEPTPHVERVGLNLGCPPQMLRIFEAPDARAARLALLQVKIGGAYARRQKNVNGWAFCFRATVGPLGRDELESLHHWFLGQKFVEFQEAEPSMDMDAPVVNAASAPAWDDGDATTASTTLGAAGVDAPVVAPAEVEESRPTAKRGRKKTGRHDPEAEAAAQVAAGQSVN